MLKQYTYKTPVFRYKKPIFEFVCAGCELKRLFCCRRTGIIDLNKYVYLPYLKLNVEGNTEVRCPDRQRLTLELTQNLDIPHNGNK